MKLIMFFLILIVLSFATARHHRSNCGSAKSEADCKKQPAGDECKWKGSIKDSSVKVCTNAVKRRRL